MHIFGDSVVIRCAPAACLLSTSAHIGCFFFPACCAPGGLFGYITRTLPGCSRSHVTIHW